MEGDRQLEAVIAHGLLNSLAVMSGAAATILAASGKLPAATRDELLAAIETQSQVFIDGLQILVREASDAFADAATAVALAARVAAHTEGDAQRVVCEALVDRTRLVGQALQGLARGLPSEVLELLGPTVAPPGAS
jgi:hypothetical protein